MPDVKLSGPEGPEEDSAGQPGAPQVIRGLASTLGQLLVEHWPAVSQDSETRWALVLLAELANAVLSGDAKRAAWLLAELDRQAGR